LSRIVLSDIVPTILMLNEAANIDRLPERPASHVFDGVRLLCTTERIAADMILSRHFLRCDVGKILSTR
jgi:hypothetical protein